MPCSAGASSARAASSPPPASTPSATPRATLSGRSALPLGVAASRPLRVRVVPGSRGARARSSSAPRPRRRRPPRPRSRTPSPVRARASSRRASARSRTRTRRSIASSTSTRARSAPSSGATRVGSCRSSTRSDPKLLALLEIMEAGWDRVGVRAKNAGHHTLWPEAFEAGAALLRECFPEECDPKFGARCSAASRSSTTSTRDRAIDFMQRRPKTDFTMSKYNPLGRLHRDPDAIDYKSRGGWRAPCPGAEKPTPRDTRTGTTTSGSRTPLGPLGAGVGEPLCVLLPRDGGAREWDYEVRTLEDNEGQRRKPRGRRSSASPPTPSPPRQSS